ncbi:MAG: penicillin-binding protein activator [Dongiaceae bacterium]
MPWLRRLRSAVGVATLLLALAGCGSSRVSNETAPGQGAPQPDGGFTQSAPLPQATASAQVALLLPLTGDRAPWGEAWLHAAELALFEAPASDVALIVRDSGGNPTLAARAAQDAINSGAQVILGPGFANEVKAVGPVARGAGINVVSFSTDETAAGEGVFVMGILPSLQVERVVGYASRQGLRHIASLSPQSPYGQIITQAFRAAAGRANAVVVRTEYYDPRVLDTSPAIGQIGQHVTAGGQLDALLVPEGGDRLRSIAPLLGNFGIDITQVRLLGSSLWDDPALAADPTLVGSWFVAPEPGNWQAFRGRYHAAFGTDPPRFASIAYDATLLAVVLAGGPNGADYSTTALTQPEGFSGVDGIFRFRPNGSVERGLAIMELRDGAIDVREPAPATFDELIY